MTDDLIARLRSMYSHRGDGIPTQYVNPNGPEAADEIERLRKFNDELRRYMYDRSPDRREMVCRKFMPEVPHD